jgi:hypothetical protein
MPSPPPVIGTDGVSLYFEVPGRGNSSVNHDTVGLIINWNVNQ